MLKKVLTVGTLVTLSIAAYAAQGYWQEISRTTEEAKTPAEISALAQKYPDLLGQLDAHTTSASVATVLMHYQGDTVCPAGDPRLDDTSYEIGTCTDNGFCSASSSLRSNQDPCAN